MTDDFLKKNCAPCEGGVKPLNQEKIQAYLEKINGWEHQANDDGIDTIQLYIELEEFEHTKLELAKICYIATTEDHHPDVSFGYNYIAISFHTHAIGGLSENDFICAAKINNLLHMPD